MERIDTLLFSSTGIGQDIEEITAAIEGTKTAGNLGLYFDHAKVALRLIVFKRNSEVFCEKYLLANGACEVPNL